MFERRCKMQLEELEDFLWRKYSLKFQPIIGGNKKIFTLQAPGNTNFFAFLSRFVRQSDNYPRSSLEHILTLDINCGDFANTIRDLPGFCDPFRVTGEQWVGLWLDQVDGLEVKKALDYAYKLAVNQDQLNVNDQYLVLPVQENASIKYKSQKIPPRKNIKIQEQKVDPIIKKMRESYDYSLFPAQGRAKNFYNQAKIAADYEDNYEDFYPFKRYFPTYHDMTLAQLRTYFTWRNKVRKGTFEKTSSSYVYVYIYELLNGIGGKDKLDSFKKLLLLQKNYVEKYDPEIDQYLLTWLQDYAIFNNLDLKIVKNVFTNVLAQDKFLMMLKNPAKVDAQEFNEALISKTKYRSHSPLGEKFADLLSSVWQKLLATPLEGKDFYQFYIAHKNQVRRPLFDKAVVYHQEPAVKRYELNSEHKFELLGMYATEVSLVAQERYLAIIKDIIHEVDRLSRKFYKKGRALKPNNLYTPILNVIKKAIIEFHEQELEAAKPKIEINFGNLSQIRQEASITRESLLTDQEKEFDAQDLNEPALNNIENKENAKVSDFDNEAIADSFDLSEDESHFLLALIKNENWHSYLDKKHLMPSILADSINEKLFDEIGDSVIEFEADQPKIIDDYQEDLEKMFLKGK